MLKNIEELAVKMGSLDNIRLELKRIQSVKCRLKKQKAKKTYEQDMLEVVAYEQALKEAREYFEPKKTTVTTMTEYDISLLNYDETMKAIKSIQSKKCNTRYLMENIEDNVEYQDACRIEKMLLEHKKIVKPIEETVVKKSELNDLVHQLENLDENVSKEYLIEQMKKLLGH